MCVCVCNIDCGKKKEKTLKKQDAISRHGSFVVASWYISPVGSLGCREKIIEKYMVDCCVCGNR